MTSIYLIGSLRNPRIPEIETYLRESGFDAFAQWYAAGPDADKHWQEYFKNKGYTLTQTLQMDFVQTAFNFDKKHLEKCEAVVLIAPAGKSGHMELGWALGKGKFGYILLDEEPDRYDLMYSFATAICYSLEELVEELRKPKLPEPEYLEWYDGNNPTIRGRIRNPKYNQV